MPLTSLVIWVMRRRKMIGILISTTIFSCISCFYIFSLSFNVCNDCLIAEESSDKLKLLMIGTPNWIAEREIIYAERNRRILETCKNYPSMLEPQAMGSGFLFDLKNHLAICMHAKVGCTTWKRNFLLLSDMSSEEKIYFDTKNRIHEYLNKLVIPQQREKGFNFDYFTLQHRLLTFSFVRHPYERIISAYEDKVLKETYFQKHLVNKSFEKFIEYVIASAADKNCFDISSSCPVDVHYRPFFNHCHYCHINYDVIGHLEESFEDMAYIAIKQNLTTLIPDLTMTNNQNKDKKSSKERIEFYMSKLNDDQKQKLYELYKLDFELFGYDPGHASYIRNGKDEI